MASLSTKETKYVHYQEDEIINLIFCVSNSKGHGMFLNGGEGTKVMEHAMVIAEFEEVK